MTAAAAVVATEAAAQAPAGRMTVHILDLFSGTPANGATVELFAKSGDAMKLVKSVKTGPDGRPTTGPLLQGETFAAGRYMVAFDLSDYFKGLDKSLPANFFRKVDDGIRGRRREDSAPSRCNAHPGRKACSVPAG